MASWRQRIAAATVLADDQLDYRRGRGRRICTPDPVIAAYVNGSLHRPCPNCEAEPERLCHHPDGTPRKAPCPRRLREANQ